MQYDEYGQELPDPTPLELPVGFTRPPTLAEMVAKLVIDPQIQAELNRAGIETEEEANDFDVEDEMPDPTSPYQDPNSIITDADEIRNGFRQKVDLTAVYHKAQKEASDAKKPRAKPVVPEAPADGDSKTNPEDINAKS